MFQKILIIFFIELHYLNYEIKCEGDLDTEIQSMTKANGKLVSQNFSFATRFASHTPTHTHTPALHTHKSRLVYRHFFTTKTSIDILFNVNRPWHLMSFNLIGLDGDNSIKLIHSLFFFCFFFKQQNWANFLRMGKPSIWKFRFCLPTGQQRPRKVSRKRIGWKVPTQRRGKKKGKSSPMTHSIKFNRFDSKLFFSISTRPDYCQFINNVNTKWINLMTECDVIDDQLLIGRARTAEKPWSCWMYTFHRHQLRWPSNGMVFFFVNGLCLAVN